MKEQDVLELDTRRRIYDHIKQAPGTHLRAIKRALGLPMGVLEYHLRYLERNEIISAKKDRYYKRYYLKDLGSRQKAILTVLRQRKPRGIVLHLILNPGTNHKDLMKTFGLGASTVSFYLKHLIEKGLIEKIKKGRTSKYYVIDEDDIVRVLITYRPSFLDKLVDHFFEAWFDRSDQYHGPKNRSNEETTFEEIDDNSKE